MKRSISSIVQLVNTTEAEKEGRKWKKWKKWNWPEWNGRERGRKRPMDTSRSSARIWLGRDTCGRRMGCTRTWGGNQRQPGRRECGWWAPDSIPSGSKRWCWECWPDSRPGRERGSNSREWAEPTGGFSAAPCRSSPFHRRAVLRWPIDWCNSDSNPDRLRWCWPSSSTPWAIRAPGRPPSPSDIRWPSTKMRSCGQDVVNWCHQCRWAPLKATNKLIQLATTQNLRLRRPSTQVV